MYIQISYLHLNEFVSEWSIPPDDYLRKNGGNDDSPMAIHPGLGMYIYIYMYLSYFPIRILHDITFHPKRLEESQKMSIYGGFLK